MTRLGRPPRYRSYLLTFWEERDREAGGPQVWRFSLQDPRTGQRRGFASLEALVAALEWEITGRNSPQSEKGGGDGDPVRSSDIR
jgi:hypothetical protein